MNLLTCALDDIAQVSRGIVLSISRKCFKAAHDNPSWGSYTVDVREREVIIEYSEESTELTMAAHSLAEYLQSEGFRVCCRAVSCEGEGELWVNVHSWLYTQLHERRLEELKDTLNEYIQSSPKCVLSGL